MYIYILLFFIGCVLLYFGSDLIIDNSVILSKRFKIPPIVVGATVEKDSKFNQGNTPNGIKELQEGICSLLPEAINWPQMEHWWGFRPCTPDLKPIIGKSKIENLFIATGHHRNGVFVDLEYRRKLIHDLIELQQRG